MNNILDAFNTLLNNNIIAPLIVFISGILVSFMPCNLSTIPLVIACTMNDKKNNSLKISLFFALGNAITITVIGIIASLLNQSVRLIGPFWYIILAIIIIIFILEMWNVINIVPSNNLINKNRKNGYVGAFLAGIFGGVSATPCSTPILLTLYIYISTSKTFIYGVLLLLLYSLGHSVLIVCVGISFKFVNKIKSMNNYEKIYNIIKVIFTMLMLLMAFYLFYLGI